jgi:small subunit ribosomal protein S2
VIPGNDDAIRAVNLVTRVVSDALAEGYGMAKDEIVEKATGQAMPSPTGAKPTAAPAAVDETPSPEDAAAIAASTVFEPDAPAAAAAPAAPEAIEPDAAATDAPAEPATEPAATAASAPEAAVVPEETP